MIGNSNYAAAPLRNPVNDARDFAAVLSDSGFEVTRLENANLREMRTALREFGDRLKKQGGVGLFYFAGHGMQVKGRNYLIPVAAQIEREDEVEFESLDANLVLEKLDSAGNRFNIVILDACRNNPFARSFRSSTLGLAQMDAPSGAIVAFATSPGSVASDGAGRNGLYTQHLVETVRLPGLKIEEVFKGVRAAVRHDSNGRQTPWESTSLEGDFYFHPTDLAAEDAERRRLEQARLENAIRLAVAQERERILKELAGSKSSDSVQGSLAMATEKPAFPKATPDVVAGAGAGALAALSEKSAGEPKTNVTGEPASFTAERPQPSWVTSEVIASIQATLFAPAGTKPNPWKDMMAPADKIIGTRMQGKIPAPQIIMGDEWEYLNVEANARQPLAQPRTSIERFTVVGELDGRESISSAIVDNPGGTPIREPRTYTVRRGLESGLTQIKELTGVRTMLFFPLEPGAKWSYSYGYDRGDDTDGRADYDSKIIDWEQVTVPAGTFWALKIEQVGWGYNLRTVAEARTPSRQTITLWYSPEVKHLVKWRQQVYCAATQACTVASIKTSELIRFSRGRGDTRSGTAKAR